MGCEEDRWQGCEDSEIRNALGRKDQQTPNTHVLEALTSTLSGPIGTLNRPSGR